MSTYSYDKNTGELTTLATSGQRVWVGTTAQYQAAKQAGTLPLNCIINITDDESDCWADGIKFDNTVSKLNASNTQDAIDTLAVYSTSEVIVGKWIDGKPIYRKVIDCGALPNTASISVNTGISNISEVIKYYGVASGATTSLVLPYVGGNSNVSDRINCYIYITNGSAAIVFNTFQDMSGYNAKMIIEYTKTT